MVLGRGAGDSWEDGKWMRGGAAVLTEAEIAAQANIGGNVQIIKI